VEREVTQIITPGTYLQDSKKDFNYLLSLFFGTSKDGNNYHIAWGDFSIGEYRTKSFSDPAELQKFILSVNPAEIIFNVDFPDKDIVTMPLQYSKKCIASLYDIPVDPAHFITQMTKVQSIASFGQALEEGRLQAL